jgi:regulator of protease activity HflC (stomatin/prohibitin superfamily)
MGGFIVVLALALLIIIVVAKTAVVVPQQSAYVVERLGKYSGTLGAGFHILIPFLDVVRYKHSLKEQAIDIPPQICITRDNVQVSVDGVLYLKVLNPERASYGISDYVFGITQLAQTTLRSEFGKIELDRTFEERTNINTQVVSELDKASDPWGIKVMRYEIKNITPPQDILAAMEKQMRAEREKRALILTSEGRRRYQHRRWREAAVDQSFGRKKAAANQRGGRRGGGHSRHRRSDRERHPESRRSDSAARWLRSRPTPRRGELSRRVRQARANRQHADLACDLERRRLDDLARHERHQARQRRRKRRQDVEHRFATNLSLVVPLQMF